CCCNGRFTSTRFTTEEDSLRVPYKTASMQWQNFPLVKNSTINRTIQVQLNFCLGNSVCRSIFYFIPIGVIKTANLINMQGKLILIQLPVLIGIIWFLYSSDTINQLYVNIIQRELQVDLFVF